MMAAPCRWMATRRVVQLLSGFSGTAARHSGLRQFSGASVCRSSAQSSGVAVRGSSPWTLMAAVCLQRLPVISAEPSPLEARFSELMQQMELEKSMLSDHELRLLEDAEMLRRKQADDYDSDEEGERGDQEIMLAQDMEDAWEQKLRKFQPAPRVRAEVDEDATSVERCLADSLMLLAQQQVGSEKLWLLPQTQWREGETLRQSAERALASLPAAFKATFLSNAPCGVFKYKLPRAVRTESAVGTKVFFFKAILSDAAPRRDPDAPLLWVKKSELETYLKPSYLKKVDSFFLNL